MSRATNHDSTKERTKLRSRTRVQATAPPGQSRKPLISVFGSSQVQSGSELYNVGHEMGRLLGTMGCDVMTGGYTGVMEAVSKGAHQVGAHVIGVTMGRFADRVNRFVVDEIRTANFYERFHYLIEKADGYVALGGGIGTLAEVSFAWQEILIGMVPRRPLVLVGADWRAMYESWCAHMVPMEHLFEPLTLVDAPAAAADFLREWFAPLSEGDSAAPRSAGTRPRPVA
jgi:uncharacterized protein (TIGR00725 family)